MISRVLTYESARSRSAHNRKYLDITFESDQHNTIPKDTNIRNKLGIANNEKIHFFAAFSGEWAKAIAKQGAIVDASDINPKIAAKLNAEKDKIRHVSSLPAEIHNLIPNYYDWSVSYEPVPLFKTKSIGYTLRTGLLNRKGIKLIYLKELIKIRLQRINKILNIYGINLDLKKILDLQQYLLKNQKTKKSYFRF